MAVALHPNFAVPVLAQLYPGFRCKEYYRNYKQ